MMFWTGLFIIIIGAVLVAICSSKKEKSKKGTTVMGTSIKSTYDTIKNARNQITYFKTVYAVEINGQTRYITDEEVTNTPVPDGTQKEFIIDEFSGKHYNKNTMDRQLKQSWSFVGIGLGVCALYFIFQFLK